MAYCAAVLAPLSSSLLLAPCTLLSRCFNSQCRHAHAVEGEAAAPASLQPCQIDLMWNPASSSVCPLVPFFTSSLSSPYLLSFTNMLKNKQPTAVSIRATMQQQHLASARNRRLAQQMENRPSVQAALSHKQVRSTRRWPTDVTAGGCWRPTVHSVTTL